MVTQLVTYASLVTVWVCLGCYVEIYTPNTGEADWRVNTSTIANWYTPATIGLDPSSQSVWYFEVKSCEDAGFILTSKPDLTGVLFEIILGSYVNTKVSLQVNPTTEHLVTTGPTLNCNSFVRFWVSWTSDGAVSVGAGDTEGVSTYFTTPKPYINSTIGGVGINSCWSSNGAIWRYGVPSSEKVPDTLDHKCPDLTTTTALTACSTTPSIQRRDTTEGYFQKEPSMHLGTLKQLETRVQCALLSCTYSCLLHSGCWYFRFDTSGTGCQPCVLYDSSVNSCLGIGPIEDHLFKWVDK